MIGRLRDPETARMEKGDRTLRGSPYVQSGLPWRRPGRKRSAFDRDIAAQDMAVGSWRQCGAPARPDPGSEQCFQAIGMVRQSKFSEEFLNCRVDTLAEPELYPPIDGDGHTLLPTTSLEFLGP